MLRLSGGMAEFSKGQRSIARYITGHYEKAAYITANRLGENAGVSESTVVRFAVELGYEGYPQMQRALRESIRSRLTSVQRIEVAEDRLAGRGVPQMVLNSDMDNIRKTLEGLDREEFAKAVESILGARRIYILGVRSSSALAGFMSFYFHLLFENVKLVNTTSASEMFEQVLRVDENDVVIGISFPRYSRRTVKVMQYARDRGARVIAITDNVNAPPAQAADMTLPAVCDMTSFVDSLAAPLSLINALVVALGMRKKTEIQGTFARLEQIWEDYEVFQQAER